MPPRKAKAAPVKIEAPPAYPVREDKILPLPQQDELVLIRRRFVTKCNTSPYFLRPKVKKNAVEKYSDRYETEVVADIPWDRDWGYPSELSQRVKKRKRKSSQPMISPLKKIGADGDGSGSDDDGDEEKEEVVEYVEEEEEEGTDYTTNYYDEDDAAEGTEEVEATI